MADKQKIAILGGGMAALSAAYELTSRPGWQDRFEITLYQMGWRLGGKCATGRGDNQRIEEHGIHAFSGSYYNALGLMADCYEELGRLRTPGVLASFDDAFMAGDRIVIWEIRDQGLNSWPLYIAPNRLSPTRYKEGMALLQQIIHGAAAYLETSYEAMERRAARKAGRPVQPAPAFGLIDGLWRPFTRFGAFCRYLGVLWRAGMLQALGVTFSRWIWGNTAGDMGAKFRRLGIFINYLAALRGGIFDPQYNIIRDGFDCIDDLDFHDWLAAHGASPQTLCSPLAYNTVDLSYNYPNGDTSQRPQMGAGTYLHWTLRMFLTLGPFAWSFEAGTGETVIAPLYHVLKARGVKFEFFHKVTALRLSADRASIGAVECDVQATLKQPERGYEPLFWVKDLRCWPDAPLYEQLVEGEALKAGKIDLESYWTPWKAPAKRVLQAGTDYDKLVFAISIGAIPHLCADVLAASDDWRNMVDFVPTCATQTMQIWLKEESGKMGATQLTGDTNQARQPTISGTFVDPFNGQVDFSNLIEHEDWRGDAPRSLWYFSGALALYHWPPFSQHDFPGQQHARVRYQSIQFLQATAGYLLPWARTPWDPLGLDFDKLHCADSDVQGVLRFDTQYWRANIDPSERYVLAPRFSTRHRLEVGASGFANLILAGDWIYNGLNVGSVEGAVMGGKLAAHALSGSPALDTIYGYRAKGAGSGWPGHHAQRAPQAATTQPS